MIHLNKLRYALLLALGLMLVGPFAGPAGGVIGVVAAQAQTVNRIAISGNSRVDDATIISYLTVRVGQTATSADIASSTNALLDTGLFSSVHVAMSGNTLNVRVDENSIVGSVLFEGNRRFPDKTLIDMVTLNQRGAFSQDRLQTDIQTIQLAYERAGYNNAKVTARTERSDNGRIRVVFEIDEGGRVGIASITFSGNDHFDAGTLKGVIRTKESNILSWLFKDDNYDEDRLAADAELIRLFYANRGYPDAQVLSHVAELDKSKNAYFINFTISEGEKYAFGDIGIETSIPGLNTDALRSAVRTHNGDRYSYKDLQRSTEDLAIAATDQGYSFADVRPRLDRDIANKIFNVTYLVDEGPRIYVERINITGNSKTRDFVIRRELDFAEGDPFNRTLVTRGKSNIEALDYFNSVNISTEQGSAPDKVVINIAVDEKATGDYGATAGYDSAQGVLGEISLTERNFLGRGQYLRVAVGASQSGRNYAFSFTEPRFMGLKVSAGVDLYKRVTDENSNNFYGTDITGGQLRFGLPLSDNLTATVFGGYEHNTIKDADNNSALVFNGQERDKAFVGYTLTYSTIDDVKHPREGFYGTFTQQYAGLDNNYVKSEVKGRYFLPVLEDGRLIASIKGQAGVVNALDGNGVHPTETYMLGSNLVRGFQAGGIGPRAASGESLGATWYAGASAEVEFPLPVLPESYGLRGAVWADVGYVGDASTAVAVPVASGATDPLRASVGASLIWDSPFGPLRGDFAHVLKKDSGDRTQFFALDSVNLALRLKARRQTLPSRCSASLALGLTLVYTSRGRAAAACFLADGQWSIIAFIPMPAPKRSLTCLRVPASMWTFPKGQVPL